MSQQSLPAEAEDEEGANQIDAAEGVVEVTLQTLPVTRPPAEVQGTQTVPLSQHATCTGNGAGQLITVQTGNNVHGRIRYHLHKIKRKHNDIFNLLTLKKF